MKMPHERSMEEWERKRKEEFERKYPISRKLIDEINDIGKKIGWKC